MLPGNWKTATISVGAIESAELDLGRSYDQIDVQVPHLDPPAKLNIKIAEKTGATFYELDPTVLEDVGSGNAEYSWEIGNNQYIKIKLTKTQSGARSFRVRGSAT